MCHADGIVFVTSRSCRVPSVQNSSGEAGPAGLRSSIPQGHLHGDRLSGEHDETHPLPEERGGEAEEEPAHC